MMYASKRRQRNFKRIRTAPLAPPPLTSSSSSTSALAELALAKGTGGTTTLEGAGGKCHGAAGWTAGGGGGGGRHHCPATTTNGTNANGRAAPPHPLPAAAAPSNPSKRHRERLNGELETVASLLPYDEATIQRLDKLSVLRLAVSFLQIKAHFHVCSQLAALQPGGCCLDHPFANLRISLGPIPSLLDPISRQPTIDCAEPFFDAIAQKALGGFLLILHLDGEIFYMTENIETYLGFQQSDVLHQPLYEMIHSEDREELRNLLQRIQQLSADANHEMLAAEWNVPLVLRFRCLLDNTCGFIRIELRSRVLRVHTHQSNGLSTFIPPPNPPPILGRPPAASTSSAASDNGHNKMALMALCIPFVPPLQMDPRMDDPILKSKHALDLGILCLDIRLRQILEMDDVPGASASSSGGSANFRQETLYSFIHPADAKYVAETHEAVIKYCSSGLMIYRLISTCSGHVYYMQSSFRLFFKNGKPDSIGGNHRVLTEVDGESLLEKRNTLKFKFLTFDDTLLQSPRIFQQPTTIGVHSPNPPTVAVVANLQTSSNDQEKMGTNFNNAMASTSSAPAAGIGNPTKKKGHHKKAATGNNNDSKKAEEKSTGKEGKKQQPVPKSQAPLAPATVAGPLVAAGPFQAEEPIHFGDNNKNAITNVTNVINENCNNGGIFDPNNAAAFFAAQLQNNFLHSATSSNVDGLTSILPSTNAATIEPFLYPSAIEAIAAGTSHWPGRADGDRNRPPSTGARLKKTQVTFEPCYTETMDLSPYYYCYPNAIGFNPTATNNNPLMDLTAIGNATTAYGEHSADYWASMMAAAAAGVDPSAYCLPPSSHHQFHFPPQLGAFAAGPDLMGELASSMLYWPPPQAAGFDLMAFGSAALPPFYPQPPNIRTTSITTANCPPTGELPKAMATAASPMPPNNLQAILPPFSTAQLNIGNDRDQNSSMQITHQQPLDIGQFRPPQNGATIITASTASALDEAANYAGQQYHQAQQQQQQQNDLLHQPRGADWLLQMPSAASSSSAISIAPASNIPPSLILTHSSTASTNQMAEAVPLHVVTPEIRNTPTIAAVKRGGPSLEHSAAPGHPPEVKRRNLPPPLSPFPPPPFSSASNTFQTACQTPLSSSALFHLEQQVQVQQPLSSDLHLHHQHHQQQQEQQQPQISSSIHHNHHQHHVMGPPLMLSTVGAATFSTTPTILPPPTPSSTTSATSGFRFLSEVAQTLFGQ